MLSLAIGTLTVFENPPSDVKVISALPCEPEAVTFNVPEALVLSEEILYEKESSVKEPVESLFLIVYFRFFI